MSLDYCDVRGLSQYDFFAIQNAPAKNYSAILFCFNLPFQFFNLAWSEHIGIDTRFFATLLDFLFHSYVFL